MTEAEWLACDDPRQMMEFLCGKWSNRKARLMSCACCQRIGHFLTDRILHQILEVAERYAEGQATDAEAAEAWSLGWDAWGEWASERNPADQSALAEAAGAVTRAVEETEAFADAVAHAANTVYAHARDGAEGERNYEFARIARGIEERSQAALLRDIVGNPFRPGTLDLLWLTPTVKELAWAIYDARTFHRLPILADALEEAGCTDADILGHCRGPGPHARGCWVVDLLLGKS